MKSLLSLFQRNDQARSDLLGFAYVSAEEPAQFAGVTPGLTVGTFTDKPPWIVVDLSLSSVVVARWPGKLWEVQILRRAGEQPRVGATYVRATAVRIERELPSATLFGKNGHAIEEVLRNASQLTIGQRDVLAERRDRGADEVFSAAWNRWLAQVEPSNPHRGQDHRDTLAVFAANSRSPVGPALTVLHSVTTKRAKELEGDAAFVVDEEEQFFQPMWASAFSALLHACMGVGASNDILSNDERSVLLACYSSLNPGRGP
jgi:hypothetical protein